MFSEIKLIIHFAFCLALFGMLVLWFGFVMVLCSLFPRVCCILFSRAGVGREVSTAATSRPLGSAENDRWIRISGFADSGAMITSNAIVLVHSFWQLLFAFFGIYKWFNSWNIENFHVHYSILIFITKITIIFALLFFLHLDLKHWWHYVQKRYIYKYKYMYCLRIFNFTFNVVALKLITI